MLALRKWKTIGKIRPLLLTRVRIGEPQFIEIFVWHFSNDPDICGYVEKYSEYHFKLKLFSNPKDKNQILVEILWIQDLSLSPVFEKKK